MKKMVGVLSILLLVLGLVGTAVGDTADMTVTVGSAGPTVDSVVVADASPTAGTTTEITVTAQITDTNGVADITTVSASFTVGSPANGNTITDMTRGGSCSNIDTDTIECIATYDMEFYDDDMAYTVEVSAEDAGAASHALTDNFAYSELIALELDATTIAFGTMAVSQAKTIAGDADMGTSGAATIKNQGNAVIDADISATDFVGDGVDSFGVEEADAQFGALGFNALSNAPATETGLDLNYGASQLENVDFKLTIPIGALPESYTSTTTITATADV